MNNHTPIRMLDTHYLAGFDESRWLYINVVDGPRLNFMQTSVIRLRNFLYDPTQQSSTISEMYHVERSDDEGMMLHSGNYSYPFSATATRRLRDFLSEVTGEKGDSKRP